MMRTLAIVFAAATIGCDAAPPGTGRDAERWLKIDIDSIEAKLIRAEAARCDEAWGPPHDEGERVGDLILAAHGAVLFWERVAGYGSVAAAKARIDAVYARKHALDERCPSRMQLALRDCEAHR